MSISLKRRMAPVVGLLVLSAIAACADRAAEESLQSADGGRDTAASAPASSEGVPGVISQLRRTAARAAGAAKNAATLPPVRQQPTQPSMIIRNGDVAIEVDSVEAAITTVRQLATSLGGYV